MTRVILVEDSTLLREGLVRLLQETGADVVAALPDATALSTEVARLAPDLVLLDIRLPPTHRDEGVRAAIALRAATPHIGVLLLSQYVEATYAAELLTSGTGGVGYLLKDRVSDLAQLHDSINRITAGGTVIDPALVAELLRTRADPLTRLTPREREVLATMAEGLSNEGIAARLVISNGAVEKHVTSIFSKLGLEAAPDAHRRVRAVLTFLNLDQQRHHGPTPEHGHFSSDLDRPKNKGAVPPA